ncbi:MAG TPA: DUF3237 domain-containing protein [Myxococcaceae bacterium]|nr:DUF3237 domain-containing protein [Myxococcaceae bacterium]
MSSLRTQLLFTLEISLHPIHDLGAGPLGRRRIVPVSGGRFEGPRLRGEVLPDVGGDWLLQRADGTFRSDVRLGLRTDDGALISLTYRGIRHAAPSVSERLARGEDVPPDEYYLRTVAFLETASPEHRWVNDLLAVGMGRRIPDRVIYTLHEVL